MEYRLLQPEDLTNRQVLDDLYDLKGARGLFDPLRFVVRLKPEMYRVLEQQASGTHSVGGADRAAVDAFSTYLHETLHWWQHIGSTTGLMLSFFSLAKTHINRRHLASLLESIGPQKSLKSFDSLHHKSLTSEQRYHLNIVLNNWHDLEFNWRIIVNPQRIRSVIDSPYFESIGHSLQIGLAHTIWMLAATFDREFSILPDIRRWEAPFDQLRADKMEGFYYGSPVRLSPVGALHIFEALELAESRLSIPWRRKSLHPKRPWFYGLIVDRVEGSDHHAGEWLVVLVPSRPADGVGISSDARCWCEGEAQQ